jgi:hypothetical protein
LYSPKHTHGLTLHWGKNDYMELWNMRMAQVVELFGLPGDRYVTDVNENSMTFWFRDANDALLFRLCHGHSELHSA